MSRITSKYQLTIPKAVAQAVGLKPGDEVTCEPVGQAVRVRPGTPVMSGARGLAERLALFDQATDRQRLRDHRAVRSTETERGWTRDALYER